MAKKLYVGNLPFSCTDAELSQAFNQYGNVMSARVVTDRETGHSKGFGFVEMEQEPDALKAVENLNGKPFMGRPLTVNEARPREEGKREGGFNRRGYDART
ncbi:RNA recognition motif domain-containing protein [Silvanigrella aquatica]|uniref:RNA-binding protein n=1 Tax=Silvanigrella aquatica TaxID=1915309 RepID=A0A1L4CXI7_9BACT|nr:RNA-binding protein [Silvanigrella aquatica]APJ02657.1 RNA-binding protein [Silvanigrella aquatica]